MNIDRLTEIVEALPDEKKTLFHQIYRVTIGVGELCVPSSMVPWVRKQFGSVEAVTTQKIVRITNRITGEESLFNRLRSLRPIEVDGKQDVDTQLEDASRRDSFRFPDKDTPEDTFGRIAGKHCITASNVAKYDGLHGLVIFNEFNPLHFSREQVIDYIDTSQEWARKAHETYPQAKYFFFIWNCLWRAGASIYHGHAQVMLTCERHYARIDRLRQSALDYRQKYGSNYFTDLYTIHQSIGCAFEKNGVKIIAHLTPFRNSETVLIADDLNLSFKERVFDALACFRDKLGVCCFNLSLATPPLSKTEESWEGFPVIARMVDRGDPASRASDVGGMEIYGATVVSSDPFDTARVLREHL